jgi:hypothetical protein
LSIKKYLFPLESRTFKGKRWFDIGLRTLHLIGLLGVAGGVLFNAEQSITEQAIWFSYFLISIISGLAMVLLSLWSNGKWLLQNRGLAIILKIILLAFIPFFHNYDMQIMVVIVIISGISSHAPAKFRYYSPILGREI